MNYITREDNILQGFSYIFNNAQLITFSEEKYTLTIFWSDEDQTYIDKVDKLKGCSAFRKTREEVLKEIKFAMDFHLHF